MHMHLGFGSVKKSLKYITLLLLLTLAVQMSTANTMVVEEDPQSKGMQNQTLYIPYMFSSETFETALGLAVLSGNFLGQKQMSVAGTIFGSSNGSVLGALKISKYQAAIAPRVFIDLFVLGARYQALRIYAGKNPKFPGERPGSNDSSAENYTRQHAWEGRVEIPFRYLLPIGAGKEEALHTYYLKRGLLISGATGGEGWDPADGGQTFITLRPAFRKQFITTSNDEFHVNTLNLRMGLEYDNRDFTLNPSRGSFQRIAYTRDWGMLEDSTSWDFTELDLTKYFSLTRLLPFRQSVLALNAWTGYSPSWETEEVDGQDVISHRPPYFEGAKLGTLDRMRGYAGNRFTGKAAIYYGAEFRVIPNWNPFPSIPLINRFDIPWWQWAVIGEVGRVADHYNLSTLHTDMKWDAGVSIRAMIQKAIGRFDIVYSPEAISFVVMAGHPF